MSSSELLFGWLRECVILENPAKESESRHIVRTASIWGKWVTFKKPGTGIIADVAGYGEGE